MTHERNRIERLKIMDSHIESELKREIICDSEFVEYCKELTGPPQQIIDMLSGQKNRLMLAFQEHKEEIAELKIQLQLANERADASHERERKIAAMASWLVEVIVKSRDVCLECNIEDSYCGCAFDRCGEKDFWLEQATKHTQELTND